LFGKLGKSDETWDFADEWKRHALLKWIAIEVGYGSEAAFSRAVRQQRVLASDARHPGQGALGACPG
jgi:hypothetical protein